MRIVIFVGSFCLMGLSASLFSANPLKRLPEDIVNPAPEKRMRVSAKLTVETAVEIGSFDDVKVDDLIAENGTTIIYFDIDGTLMRNALWFDNFDAEFKKELIDDFYQSGESSVNPRDQVPFREFLLSRDMARLPKVLVENSAPELLTELKENGAIIVGLTARHNKIAGQTKADLLGLGIDFAQLSEMDKTEFTGVGVGDGFIDGIYYTNFHGNKYFKAQIIVGLTEMIRKKLGLKGAFTVGHLDDNMQEIGAFEEVDTLSAASKNDMVITPYYYCADDEMRNDVVEDRTEIYQELNSLYVSYLGNNQW